MLKETRCSYWKMERALKLAERAMQFGEVPVGAVVLSPEREVIAQAANRVEQCQDPFSHAEMLALRQALRVRRDKRLTGCSLVVTLEPCPMCAGAAMHARVARIVFGAYDPKGGGIEHGSRVFSHRQTLYHPEIIGGVQERACQALLRRFFLHLR